MLCHICIKVLCYLSINCLHNVSFLQAHKDIIVTSVEKTIPTLIICHATNAFIVVKHHNSSVLYVQSVHTEKINYETMLHLFINLEYHNIQSVSTLRRHLAYFFLNFYLNKFSQKTVLYFYIFIK